MDELKTLKDFEDQEGSWQGLEVLEEIKAEAIKWYHRSDGNKHTFIRHFFNITEEDLK